MKKKCLSMVIIILNLIILLALYLIGLLLDFFMKYFEGINV